MLSNVETELDEPILFRTTSESVFKSTLEAGSLWLRSDQYYRDLEDKARNDVLEGVNSGTTALPLKMQTKNGVEIRIMGDGHIGQLVRPHYIVSLHGNSISPLQREAFGGHTFGIRSLSRLSTEVLFEACRKIRCSGYRYGPVYYRYSAFAQSLASAGGAAIRLGDDPPCYLNPLDTDVLRKRPVKPFIEQDEWRIVVFTHGYLQDDPTLPLQINVATSHFYPYLGPN